MRAFALAALLAASLLMSGCSSAAKDTDGDQLRDKTERNWPRIYVDLMDRRIAIDPTSDPGKGDTDGDGLSDFDEFFTKSDPRDPDTDKDGLTDCQELVHTVQAECEDPAYAGEYDGGYGTSPVRADSDPGPVRYLNQEGRFKDETGTLANGRVEWGDGISDKDEVVGYTVALGGGRTRFIQSDPRNADSDGDGLEDGEEALLYESDPLVPDTDGDGCDDAHDPWPGREALYAFGLQSIQLKADKDVGGGSDLAFTLQVAGQVQTTESRHIEKGTTDLRAMSPAAVPTRGCPAGPLFPWVVLQVLAHDQDTGSAPQTIDFWSGAGKDGGFPLTPTIHWNVRTQEFAWDPSTNARLTSPVRLEGTEAVLTFAPTVTFPQGS